MLGWPYNTTFHRLASGLGGEDDSTCLTVEVFEEILDLIAGRNDVRVTFDDGNASDFKIAFPAHRGRDHNDP